ncbi:MAG: amidase [Myxococcota bacterium]|nr:amidase [Myxococcota bacterium]
MTDGAKQICATTDDAMGTSDAVGLASRIASGEVSHEEVVDAAIERARAVDPLLNAIACEDFERARAAAAAKPAGPLGGVPTFIKDTDAVAGLPNRVGSRATSAKPAAKSSRFVTQFESTGVVSLGLSTTPEFGQTATAESSLNGPTRNPWNPAFSPGGSSGGAAALVAAGVVPIAHGNDGAGSIRIPASACGLVGLKPSRGRVATTALPAAFPVNFLHQGVLTRTVRDTATFLRAAEPHAIEHGIKDPLLPGLGKTVRAREQPLRIGFFVEGPDGVACDSQCAAATERAAALCESLGHSVARIENPFAPTLDRDFWIACWSLLFLAVEVQGRSLLGPDFDRGKLEDFSHFLAAHFLKNAHRFPFARQRTRAFASQYDDAFAQLDVLLTPTLGGPTPELGYFGPEVPGEVHLERLRRYLPFTPPHNVSGAPAVSLPLGSSAEGMPIGVMFAARLGEDDKLLELALQIEQAGAFVPGLL